MKFFVINTETLRWDEVATPAERSNYRVQVGDITFEIAECGNRLEVRSPNGFLSVEPQMSNSVMISQSARGSVNGK